MKYKSICPMCCRPSETRGDVTTAQLQDYRTGTLVQKAFPNLDAFDREIIINGTCYDCQEKMYNRPAPGHEEKFGEYICDCDVCGAPLWEKDRKEAGITCPTCYNVIEQ